MMQPIAAGLPGLLVLLCSISALGQAGDIRFGTVDIEDLQMDSFPRDSNATAVILYDYAKASFSERFDLEVEFIRRVKILTEPGYEYATVRIPYYSERRTQQVRGIRGFTHNLDANGEIERTSLSSRSVFHEDADGSYSVASFTLPNIRPGSVVEYRYVLRSSNPMYLPSWDFQHEEPVRWSEYIVEIPQMLEYTMVMQGRRPLSITDREPFNMRRGIYDIGGTRYRYVARDLPAMREEPFMTTIDNYRLRINFQLSRIVPLDGTATNVMNTWASLNEDLNSNSWFGREMRGSREIRRLVPEIVEGLDTELDIMRAVYDYVRETMEWDGLYRVVPEGVANAFRARQGNSADINMLLVAMLREAGLEADPVILSRRSRGRVQQLYPILSQFNHLVVMVEMGEFVALLDATERDRPFNLLPIEALNGNAWRVSPDKGGWINIRPNGSYRSRALVQVSLTPDGYMRGSAQKLFADYSALSMRRTLRDLDEDEYVRERFLRQINGARPLEFEIKGTDAIEEPIIVTADFESYDYVHSAGDFIYVNPFIMDRLEENPFRTPERDFPVDFGVGSQHQYVLRMEIPEGYELHEHPRTLNLRLKDDAGDFVRAIQEEDGTLSISTVYRLNHTTFAPGEYKALREFFNRIVAANAEQVVLRRISLEAAEDATEMDGTNADDPDAGTDSGGEQQ